MVIRKLHVGLLHVAIAGLKYQVFGKKVEQSKHGTGGLTMATGKCALGKRGRPSHEWNDGKKDRIYCLGWIDPMTDDPLPECLACPDFVDKAQDDLEAFYGRC